MQTFSNDAVDLSWLSGDNVCDQTSCSQTISNVIDATTVDSHQTSTKSVKPNLKKLHEEYKLKWKMNPPPNETRPMRLVEFIWSNCDGSSNQLDVDYGSDDSTDVLLTSITETQSTPLREIFAYLNKKYEENKGPEGNTY